VVGRDHAAFASADDLVPEEAEGGDVADGANSLAVHFTAVSLRGIFEHP
jgi:hypothetical protein